MAEPTLRTVEFTPVRTDRLLLRLAGADDHDAMGAILRRDEVCRYLRHDALTMDEVAARYERTAGTTALTADGQLVRIVVVRRTDEQLLGEVVLIAHELAAATVEIGWVFHPDHQGHGYATEAATALVDHAFEQLEAHRVIARLHPDNAPSAAVCTRLGMRPEAHFRADIWLKGEWQDTLVFARLDAEHRSQRSHSADRAG